MTQKVSEWLACRNSHDIYDAKGAADDFTNETGLEPCWITHSAREMVGMIKARGLGGNFSGNKPAVSGYEIAEALADKLAPEINRPHLYGRGSRFNAALEALQKKGL